MRTKLGMVYLVGAGPGDPGLLTLRAADLIRRAEVLIYDALVNPTLLQMAGEGAEIIFAGKRATNHALTQEELNKLLADKAKEGKMVVRLKGGDPYIFGRGGEEILELQGSDVPFEVVPGISSFVAAPNFAGIPLTHRDHCSGFTVVTGHEDPSKDESSIDWKNLAESPGTKVVLMGVARIGLISEKLMDHGMSGDTPIAMVRWATTGRQNTIVGTLATIEKVVEDSGFKAPAVTIIGDVVGLRPSLNWFEKRPLFNKRIVVTRTRCQASKLSARLSELGAEALEIPTIKIAEPDERQYLLDAILTLHTYSWLVFTSPNGVDEFFKYFFRAFKDLRDIGGVKIAAVGPATAAKLEAMHLQIDAMPKKHIASELAKVINNEESVENLNVMLLRAQVATKELPDQLEAFGAIVDDIPVYKTVPETEDLNGSVLNFESFGADWITFTSASTVEHFDARMNLSETMKKWPHLKLASIGPETSKAIRALDLEPYVEAKEHTIDGLVDALLAD
ncbi:uroporphyrinogen-III C-methyltransferase [Verrucomicrobia bacterium]|nr:uroporphyrinogen-III C-methyltransferase [Verrucomicrobiota bacterium]